MLQFNSETTRLLENAYRGSDFVKRRLATLEALAPRPGETIVDVGSGLGHLTIELSRVVGDAGEVIGVDPSIDMRTAAATQCDGLPNVRILDGTAAELPLDDGSAAVQPLFRCSSISAIFLVPFSRSGGCCAQAVAWSLGTCTGTAGYGTATSLSA